jgi:hypothetical protein
MPQTRKGLRKRFLATLATIADGYRLTVRNDRLLWRSLRLRIKFR